MDRYIGQAARAAGTTTKAIRYYESLGVLGPVARKGTYRVFSERDIALIRLIKQAQEAGFRLSEFKEALVATDAATNWATLIDVLDAKQAEIARQIEQLERQKTLLRDYAETIRACLEADPACSGPLP